MRDVGPIAANGRFRAVEKGVLERVGSMVGPVPVWLNTTVAAFIDECLFIGMNKVSMPGKEYGLRFDQLSAPQNRRITYGEVNDESLVDVGCRKIVESTANPRCNGPWCYSRLRL